MPLAQITLIEGNDEDRKRDLIARVTEAIAHSLATPAESVRIIITEVPASAWGVGGLSVSDRAKAK